MILRLINKLLSLVFPPNFETSELLTIAPAPPFPRRDIFSLFDYHDPKGKALIYSIKKYQDPLLSEKIAEQMYDELLDFISEKQLFNKFTKETMLIIPMPISKNQMSRRGFNQVELISKKLAYMLSAPVNTQVLKKIKETKKQAHLKERSLRFKNVKNCFDVIAKHKKHIQNKDVIIVDDLVTTAATFLECKKVCENYGARSVILITVAH